MPKSLLRNSRGQFRMWIASQDYHSTLIHFNFFSRGTLLLKWQLFIIDQTCFSSWFLHDLYLCFWDKALLVAWLLRTCLKQAWLIENPQHCGHNFSSKKKAKINRQYRNNVYRSHATFRLQGWGYKNVFKFSKSDNFIHIC